MPENTSATAALPTTGSQSATTYARSGETPPTSRAMSIARDVTATLICAKTWPIARRCATRSCRRAAAMPFTMKTATSASLSKNPAVTNAPPLASKASTAPVGASAKRMITPAARPTQRWIARRRCTIRVMSRMHRGSETSAAATWTRNDASQSVERRTGNFSIANGGSSWKSKYARLDVMMTAAPSVIAQRNRRRRPSLRTRCHTRASTCVESKSFGGIFATNQARF